MDKPRLVKVCVIGPRKTGKSTMIGSILVNHLPKEFVVTTSKEVIKAGLAPWIINSWLVDRSKRERDNNHGTIVPSCHVIQSHGTVVCVTDTPGNEAYLHETLRMTVSNNDCLVLVLDYDRPCNNYVIRFARLCIFLSMRRLVLVLTNVHGRSIEDNKSYIYLTDKLNERGKFHYSVLTIDDLRIVNETEIAAILDAIIAIGSSVSRDNNDSALRAPLLATIINVHRTVNSSRPVLVARIMAGYLSAGLNISQSAVAIFTISGGVPTQHSATVKSMRVDEAGVMRPRAFAFVDDLVELTLPEIKRVGSVRRGDLIRHRRHDGFGVQQRKHMLVQLVLMSYGQCQPLHNGSVVTMWTVTKTVVATVRRIETVEYAESDNVTRRPMTIDADARKVLLRLTTDKPIPFHPHSGHKLHILLLFQNSLLFAAGRIEVDDK